MNDIKVSIICITYNQEKYIDKAIESFVMQKTTFPFEIIIHDDASIDSTPEHVKEWCTRYPTLIRTVFQKENKFSQNPKSVFTDYTFPIARGKYIAICEGDDFWSDPYKLEKQFRIAEAHSEYSLVVHAANTCNEQGVLRRNVVRPYKKSCVMPLNDIVMIGAEICHTASMFFRRDCISDIPDFYFVGRVSDFHLMLLLASRGTVYYLDEFMSVYRVNAIGSMVADQRKNNKKRIESYEEGILTLKKYKEYLGEKAIPEIDESICIRQAFINAYCGKSILVLKVMGSRAFWKLKVRKKLSLIKCAIQNRNNG